MNAKERQLKTKKSTDYIMNVIATLETLEAYTNSIDTIPLNELNKLKDTDTFLKLYANISKYNKYKESIENLLPFLIDILSNVYDELE